MSSIWTRNFYDRDSVADALVSSIVYKHPLRKAHSLFWAHELWISEEIEVLQKSLTKAFLQLAPFDNGIQKWKHWSQQNHSEFESETLKFLGILLAQPALSSEKPKNSEFRIQNLESKRLELLKTAGRTRTFLLLEPLSVKESSALLPEWILKSADPAILKVWKQTGKGLAWVTSVPALPFQTPLSLEWPKRSIGRLSARTFRTPKRKHAFISSPFGVFSGCAAWQRILKEAGLNFTKTEKEKRLVFEIQEAEETFYLQYFPDDIPDEWSILEKEKGHILP